MTLKFTKMHGLGNDFMVIDGINQSVNLDANQVIQLADRHRGIGFDQLLLVESPQGEEALFRYRIFNADGAEVDQCGNGARCFARFVHEEGLTAADVIPVETRSGLLRLRLMDAVRVEVDMGVPAFDPAEIPLTREHRAERYEISLDGTPVHFSALSMGNPHAVIQVDNVDTADVEGIGPKLEAHADFPARVNVGFMQIIDRNRFRLRVFERGVGETQACGSGACAAMVAARQLDLVESEASAELIGGELKLRWQGEGQPVMMTGDTALVYRGEITL